MEEEETVLHFLSSSFPPSSSLHALKVNRAHQTEKRKEGREAGIYPDKMGKAEKGERQGSSAPNLTKEVVNSQMPPLPSPTYFLAPTIMYGGILPFPPCANRKCKEGRERRSGEGILRPEIPEAEAEGDLEKVHTRGDVGNERKLGRNLSLGGGLYPNMGSRRIAKIALKDKLSPLGSFFSHLPATELTVFSPLSVFLARHR